MIALTDARRVKALQRTAKGRAELRRAETLQRIATVEERAEKRKTKTMKEHAEEYMKEKAERDERLAKK